MISRLLTKQLEEALSEFPVVALIGSRQAGKTTLAKNLIGTKRRPGIYLDLELPSDLAKLTEPEIFLSRHRDRLVVLDEIQHVPQFFGVLRALVDQDRRPGRFLVLGSASPDLLRQTSESLAGRIAYVELTPFLLPEIEKEKASGSEEVEARLWLRGGYPPSFLARTEKDSVAWRQSFIKTFLERDLPQLGVRIPATQLRRFWQMLAHWQGQLWNANAFARNFDVSAPTVRHYLDVLTDTHVVRQLQPFHSNLKKRLVKSPKVYLRDSGILHALMHVDDIDAIHGHPMLGSSFEGFALEQIVSLLPSTSDVSFYRTHAGAEIDLIVDLGGRKRFGVEIKYTATPSLGRGMREALEDTRSSRGYVVTAGRDAFPLSKNIEAMPLAAFLRDVILPLSA